MFIKKKHCAAGRGGGYGFKRASLAGAFHVSLFPTKFSLVPPKSRDLVPFVCCVFPVPPTYQKHSFCFHVTSFVFLLFPLNTRTKTLLVQGTHESWHRRSSVSAKVARLVCTFQIKRFVSHQVIKFEFWSCDPDSRVGLFKAGLS